MVYVCGVTKYSRKYYLNLVMKKKGYKVKSRSKVVYIPFDHEVCPRMAELRDKFGYVIQTEIV